MAKHQNLSNYQRGIARRYYEHLDTIMVQKLGEIVSELYLADSESARTRLWERARKALANAKVKREEIDRVVGERDLETLAAMVNDLAGPAERVPKRRSR